MRGKTIPFGQYLRERRQDEKLSIRAFAAAAGICFTKVFRIETGAGEYGQSDLEAIAKVFHESPALFLSVHEHYASWRKERKARLKELNASWEANRVPPATVRGSAIGETF